jgi:hypothetical protein
VDVAALTFEEAVAHRKRVAASEPRICSAYTVDSEDRVLLRAAPSSSAVVAVALSVLLAACDSKSDVTPGTVAPVRVELPAASVASALVRAVPVASLPAATPSSADPALPSAPASSEPACVAPAPGTKKTPHKKRAPYTTAGF